MSNAMDSRKAHMAPVDEELELEEAGQFSGLTSVPVVVENTVKVLSQKFADPSYDVYVTYVTMIVPPLGVVQVLPQDELRISAVIRVFNANVVLCGTQGAAQAVGNIQATSGTGNYPPTPQGALIGPATAFPAFENNEPAWLVNCDPTLSAYVSMVIERGGA